MESKSILSYWSQSKYIIVVILLCICALVLFMYRMKINQKDIQVYDLTWPDKTDVNRPVFRRWRYFIEAKTNLPRKVEKYYKLIPEDDYILEETLVLPISSPNKYRFFAKIQIFLDNFSVKSD